jgi:hypothetical protein
VRQVGYLQRLYRDTRSTEHRIECSCVWTDTGLIFALRKTEHVCITKLRYLSAFASYFFNNVVFSPLSSQD